MRRHAGTMPIMRLRGIVRWALLGAPARTFDSAPRPVDRVIAEMFGTGSAPRVGRAEALSVPAVQRARNMICSIATLPLVRVNDENEVVRSALLEQIDPDVPNVVTLSQTIEDLLFEGIAWWRIVAYDWAGFPAKARRLDPGAVSLQPPNERGAPAPLPGGEDPREASVWIDGNRVSTREVIRFDSPNPAVLKTTGRAVKRAILLDQTARMYADDPRPLDYVTTRDGAEDPEDGVIENFLGQWASARRRRKTAWVPSWVSYESVESPSPADLQLVELKRDATLEIANGFGVDPEDLGVSTTSRTYANAVDRRRDRINDVLAPYMRALTDRLSMNDVTPRGNEVRFDLDDYMKSNPTERWGTYKIGKELGVLTPEEIARREGIPVSVLPNEADVTRSDTAAAPASEVPPAAVGAAAAAVPAGFAGPELRTFEVSVHGFTVDAARRVVEGLALPFNSISSKYGLKFRFAPGSLVWSEPRRNKLLRDHDFAQALGYAEDLTETGDGYRVRYKVARGAEGDRALELAEDGVLDGLSVGVDFDLNADTVPDPDNDGVLLVRRADWRETSLTAMPAFDDARVTRVAASREGEPMIPTPEPSPAPSPAPNPNPAPAPAPAVAAPAPAGQFALSPEQLTALQGIFGTPAAPAAARETVNAAAVPATTGAFVREPQPYRFDRRGNLRAGAHEFSADLIAGLRDGDGTAYRRAMEFVRAQFDVISTDVNELNPTTNRPDMYVDQRDFRYPVWNAIDKGTLSDITPFTFPKFNSASGLVGAHTEGVEPTSGTFTVTNQTVTPTAVSGKAKISRETWDQGGNPQIGNLIWQQMLKSWFEALEAAAVAALDAVTPTAIALTAGGGTTGQTAAAELKAAIASLQFVRGGFAFTDAFTQIDLYKALAGARDGDGRPLFPIIGPTNADGTAEPRLSAIMVDGVQFLPSWALAATGVVVASSYLFDRQSVHGWASAPQRLTIDMIEVANVYIGLWGYKATAVSDLTGVREITYDPVP